jgi:antitoxin (DNA-binding transcriptional repressor) of toxin-antitoxin stability system
VFERLIGLLASETFYFLGGGAGMVMKNDHGQKEWTMRQMEASVFKVRCLVVIREIQASGEPVMVLRRGKPWVKVVPVETEKGDLFGFMAGELKITGDIESPIWHLRQRKITKK